VAVTYSRSIEAILDCFHVEFVFGLLLSGQLGFFVLSG